MVIQCDVASHIPGDAESKEAVLSIFFTSGSIGNKYTTVYRLKSEWDVSTVTWMDAASNVPWSAPGGDYSVENSFKTDYAPDSSWEHYDVTNIVRLFTHAETNYGFIIQPDHASGNKDRQYCASEYSDPDSLRPKLTVTYSSSSINNLTQYPNLLKGIKLQTAGSAIQLFVPFEKPYQLSLLNSGGRIIESFSGSSRQWYQLKTAELSNGIYFVQVRMDNKTAVGKVFLLK